MIVYLNGQFVPEEQARVSVFDRGFLMGDGIYEGIRTSGGTIVALRHHVERMREGMTECRIPVAGREGECFDPAAMAPLTARLLEENRCDIPAGDAEVYWQVTRGAPAPGQPRRSRVLHGTVRPCVFAFAAPAAPVASYRTPKGRRVALRPDTRWSRGHVKSISLLGSVLAAIEAEEHGCDDAILTRDGLVTEGAATNVFIARGGTIFTPSLDSAPMLAGATRDLLLGADPSIVQKPITVGELLAADEVMLAGTYTMVAAATHIDGRPIGGGAPGPMATRLLATLVNAIERDVARTRGGGAEGAGAGRAALHA